jgi:hypothetical protein
VGRMSPSGTAEFEAKTCRRIYDQLTENRVVRFLNPRLVRRNRHALKGIRCRGFDRTMLLPRWTTCEIPAWLSTRCDSEPSAPGLTMEFSAWSDRALAPDQSRRPVNFFWVTLLEDVKENRLRPLVWFITWGCTAS